MKTIFKSILSIAIISLTLSACSKYEEGPKISLRSKKARLCGDWKLVKFLINGNDSTAAVGTGWTVDIEKDGKYSIKGFTSGTGTWRLGEDKDDVFFKQGDTAAIETAYRIRRLKNKEFWLQETLANGDKYESQYEAE